MRLHQVKRAIIRAIRKPSLAAILVAAMFIAAYLIPQQVPISQTGITTVHDGDTIRVNDKKYRIYGIDAPELTQKCSSSSGRWACGEKARDYLISLIGDKQVSCTNEGKSYDRIVGRCFIENQDLGEQMVLAGYALAYRSYSERYVPAEEIAMKEKHGIWAGSFENPWDWRKEHK